MSPVARRVLFGASGEETMPGERGNTMAMSELVVSCLFIPLSCYLDCRPVSNAMAMSELVDVVPSTPHIATFLTVLHCGIQPRQMHAASHVLIDLHIYASLHASSECEPHSLVASGPSMELQSVCMAPCLISFDFTLNSPH